MEDIEATLYIKCLIEFKKFSNKFESQVILISEATWDESYLENPSEEHMNLFFGTF